MRLSDNYYAEILWQITQDKSGGILESAIRDFVELLRDRHEVSRWRGVVRSFENIWRRRFGAATVIVTTPREPTDALRKIMARRFPFAQLTFLIKPELLGGAIIQTDDRRLDGSIAGRLERLKKEFCAR